MTKQSENSEVTKPESKTVPDADTQKQIEHVAKKASEKASHAEQRYDKDHDIFSK
jgi:hypothetical protein